jgi:hypothetical protein
MIGAHSWLFSWGILMPAAESNGSGSTWADTLYSSSIGGGSLETGSVCLAFRYYIDNISFNNTTEINSTVYFCRKRHNEFNYSSNPTYLSGSRIRTKQDSRDIPVAYVTGVGLYSHTRELLAVAKLSEPLRSDSNTELIMRVRIDT